MRYLTGSVRFGRDQAAGLLDDAERDGKAEHERATVTCAAGVYEIRRPGFQHRFGSYYYLDDLHPVECTEATCYCRHYRFGRGGGPCRGDPPERCRCGHVVHLHRWREVRATLDVCKAPDTWFTADMATFNALLGVAP
jgi:hypothetical protein